MSHKPESQAYSVHTDTYHSIGVVDARNVVWRSRFLHVRSPYVLLPPPKWTRGTLVVTCYPPSAPDLLFPSFASTQPSEGRFVFSIFLRRVFDDDFGTHPFCLLVVSIPSFVCFKVSGLSVGFASGSASVLTRGVLVEVLRPLGWPKVSYRVGTPVSYE